MVCLLITSLIFLSCYYLTSSIDDEPFISRILLASVIGCASIVLSETTLGLIGALTATNIAVLQSLLITTTFYFAYKRSSNTLMASAFSDLARIKDTLHDNFDRYNAALGILVLLTYSWILVAAFFLPPRGVDDLSYHLPSIYDYIQSHAIKLLPIQRRTSFAFPQNAELLFMWPVLFSKNQRFVSGLNIPFVALSALVVYAFLRNFHISKRDSLFSSFLYALCPVVIMQSGVNYIDIIVSLFVLISLYLSIRFYSTGKTALLYGTGLTTGLLLGMKYTALLLTLPVHLLVFVGLYKHKVRGAYSYALTVLLLSAWWYVRNYLVTHNPTFPLDFFGASPTASGNGGFLRNVVTNIPHWPSRYLVDDIGIGTYDGGFGLVFWGVGFSSWLYYCVYALCRPSRTGLARLFAMAYLPMGFISLLAVPEEFAGYNGRFAIFIVAIGLWAFCETMKVLDDTRCRAVIKFFCLLLSVMTLALMFKAQQPTYDISEAVHDNLAGGNHSMFKYLNNALPSQAGLGCLWQPLDLITREDGGINCYIMGEDRLFAPGPVYGANLQNHVQYSFDGVDKIDAFIYTYYPSKKNDTYHSTESGKEMPPLLSLSPTVSSYDIIARTDYLLVSNSNRGCLLAHKRIANDPARRNKLQGYYRAAFPGALEAARDIAPLLKKNVPVVTSSPIGYGLRYASGYRHPVDLIVVTPCNMEEIVARRRSFRTCYSLDRPLEGYSSVRVSSPNGTMTVNIYLNKI